MCVCVCVCVCACVCACVCVCVCVCRSDCPFRLSGQIILTQFRRSLLIKMDSGLTALSSGCTGSPSTTSKQNNTSNNKNPKQQQTEMPHKCISIICSSSLLPISVFRATTTATKSISKTMFAGDAKVSVIVLLSLYQRQITSPSYTSTIMTSPKRTPSLVSPLIVAIIAGDEGVPLAVFHYLYPA